MFVLTSDVELLESQCKHLLDFFGCGLIAHGAIETVYLSFCSPDRPKLWQKLFEVVLQSGVADFEVYQEDQSLDIRPSRSLQKRRRKAPETRYPSLTKFNPEAPFLFSSLVLPWTLDVINSSRLRALTLRCQQVKKIPWSLILPLISVPTLRRLEIGGHINMLTLTDFLHNHPALEELYVTADSNSDLLAFKPTRVPPRHPSLLRLKTLHAPASYLIELIGAAVWGSSASLTWLHILPDCHAAYAFRPCVEHILREVADMEILHTISIQVPPDVGKCTTTWCSPPVPSGPDPYARLGELTFSPVGSQESYYAFSDAFMVRLCTPMICATDSLLQETIGQLVKSLATYSASPTSLKIHEGEIDPSGHPGMSRTEVLREFSRIEGLSYVVIQSGPEKREWPTAPSV